MKDGSTAVVCFVQNKTGIAVTLIVMYLDTGTVKM